MMDKEENSEFNYDEEQAANNNNLISLLPGKNQQPNNYVNSKLLLDGSVRYTTSGKLPSDIMLPRPKAVILDPLNKWNGHPKVSIEFNKLNDKNNLTSIYEALDLLKAKYEFREISLLEYDVVIEVLRITSESVRAMSYLSNVYEPFSIEVAQMFRAPLIPMLHWTLERYQPTITQDFSIWMAHWSDKDSHEIMLVPPKAPEVISLYNNTCYNEDYQEYLPKLKNYENDYEKYIKDHKALTKQDEVKLLYRSWDEKQREFFFQTLLENKINELKNGILAVMTEKHVKAEIERLKYEESLHVFDSVEQCQSFLSQNYPNINDLINSFNDQIKIEWKFLENYKQEFYDSTSKSSKDLATIVGTLVFDVARGIVPTTAGTIIGGAISVTKLTACIYSFFSRNQILDLSDKKVIEKLDINQFIQEFTCKVSVCNASKFMNLTSESRDSLAKIYAKYLFVALIHDKGAYIDASHFIDIQIDRMQNRNSVTNLKLADEIENLGLELVNGSRVDFYNYIGDQGQDQCYHRARIAENNLPKEMPGEVPDLAQNLIGEN